MLEEVFVRATACLGDQVQAHDAGHTEATEVVAFEDVKDALDDRHPGRPGYADDLDAAITASQPVVVDPRLVRGKIFLKQNPAVRTHVRPERLRDLSAVEDIRP